MATKFEHEPYPRPDPHTGLALQIAQYLHAAGIVADPMDDQNTTSGVAVYCGGWEDTPNTAVGVMGVLSLIHISEPTRREWLSRMPSSA